MSLTEKNKTDRRRAFRIYEQVDIYYHKLDIKPEINSKLNSNQVLDKTVQPIVSTNTSDSPPLEQFLPASHSQENNTLNANISATGISFTSKEELLSNKYLMIRILLLSSMTVIMTCCRVVYVKPSNPFEKNQYPYVVGTHFVNLKAEDKQLLHNHINKRKNQRLIINSLLVSFFMSIILLPDLAFELFINFGSFVFDNIIQLAHLCYEIIEYCLDLLIEQLFNTDVKKTQVIVFYTQVFFSLAITYPLYKVISSYCKNIYIQSRLFYVRKRSSLLYSWGEKTLLYKTASICFAIFSITIYVLFLI